MCWRWLHWGAIACGLPSCAGPRGAAVTTVGRCGDAYAASCSPMMGSASHSSAGGSLPLLLLLGSSIVQLLCQQLVQGTASQHVATVHFLQAPVQHACGREAQPTTVEATCCRGICSSSYTHIGYLWVAQGNYGPCRLLGCACAAI
jgi:hypothetical protein